MLSHSVFYSLSEPTQRHITSEYAEMSDEMFEQSSNITTVICSIVSSSMVRHMPNKMCGQIQSHQLLNPQATDVVYIWSS